MLALVQLYRALAILLVMQFHAGLLTTARYGHSPVEGWWDVGFSGVHLFFVLSGFIIFTAHYRDIGHPNALPRYLFRRLVRIYPLYWIVFMVWGGWRLFSGQLSPPDFWSNALWFHSNTKLVIPVSWTLGYEMVFYLIFCGLLLQRTLGFAMLGLWLVLVLMEPETNRFISPINVLFMLGLCSGMLCKKFGRLDTEWRDIIGISALGLGTLGFTGMAFLYHDMQFPIEIWAQNPWSIWGFGLSSMVLLIASISPRLEVVARRLPFALLIGDASYALYLVHLQFEKIGIDGIKMARLLWEFQRPNPIAADLIWIATTAFALVAGIWVHRWIEVPLVFHWLRRRLR